MSAIHGKKGSVSYCAYHAVRSRLEVAQQTGTAAPSVSMAFLEGYILVILVAEAAVDRGNLKGSSSIKSRIGELVVAA